MTMKLINRVTITGADDKVAPEKLFEVSEKYPFVEWGILVSKRAEGNARFPSWGWIADFIAKKRFYSNINTSCHICGHWVRNIIEGGHEFAETHRDLYQKFDRFQLNFHAEQHEHLLRSRDDYLDALTWLMLGSSRKTIIFQIDLVNTILYEIATSRAAQLRGIRALPFYDLSHGAGRLPTEWLEPIGSYCGYAGGLTPDNVVGQIGRINNVIWKQDGDLPAIWIDTETGVRTNNDFDLTKVVLFLERVSPYVNY